MRSNLNIFCSINNPYTVYGLGHFCRKYNFSLEKTNPDNAGVYIGYSEPPNNSYKIIILLQPAKEEGLFYVRTNDQTFPIFCRPQKSNGINCIMKVEAGKDNYPCLSINGGRIEIGFDVFAETGKILNGKYDTYYLRDDEVGNTLKHFPIVDMLEETVYSAFKNVAPSNELPARLAWPENKSFALVLTHDVDRVFKTYQYTKSIFDSLKSLQINQLFYHFKNMLCNHGSKNPYWTFNSICELENNLGVKSTYYFLNETGKHNPFSLKSWILFRGIYDIKSEKIKNTINWLAQNGFEIGVHGSYYSYNNLNLLKQEKMILEQITNANITGIRQHYLNYDNDVTPLLHHNAGFSYDTSIGYKPAVGIGFRRGTSFPFQTLLKDGKIDYPLEIPLIIMDGALDEKADIDDCHQIIEQVAKYHGVLTILWHNNRLNDLEFPGMIDKYKYIIETAISKNAWVATANEIYNWLNRENKERVRSRV